RSYPSTSLTLLVLTPPPCPPRRSSDLHGHYFFAIGRQRVGDILQGKKGGEVHQEVAEEQGRRARTPAHALGHASLRALVVGGLRSEERRVGKECRCRWEAEQDKET